MICLKCDGTEFNEASISIEQSFKGELFAVNVPAMICKNCGWYLLKDGQTDELRRATADEYRRRRGLLTSAEIRQLREDRKMTQKQFAHLLGVGEASVKRWETWLVQERSSDHLIRLVAPLKDKWVFTKNTWTITISTSSSAVLASGNDWNRLRETIVPSNAASGTEGKEETLEYDTSFALAA